MNIRRQPIGVASIPTISGMVHAQPLVGQDLLQ
jgi:hypothetical protein